MAAATVEEDVVVEEIPIYLSKNLQDSLYLFQYPTKVQRNIFDNAEVVNCCVKPINEEIKIDFGVDTNSSKYDKFKGRQIALAEDGKHSPKGARLTFKTGVMDKISFTSTKAMERDVRKYAVGIFADNEIHLTPLTSMQLMRPSLSHFDKEDTRIKAEQKALNEEDDDEELQQVSVKFARPGVPAKKPSLAQFISKSADEPWCETYWQPSTSPAAALERQKLFCTNVQISHALSLDREKYINKLLPNAGQSHGIDALLPPRVIAKAHLKTMSLADQLKNILKDTKILPFDEIVSFLQENIDPKTTADKVLRVLPQVALLLNGNWVPQSEVLYPPGTFSNLNSIPSEQMTRARDYIIFRFSRCAQIYRRQVLTATQLPLEEAGEVLESVAQLNTEKKWELLLPPNKDFEQRYPDLVQRQEILWRAAEQMYMDMDFEKSPKRARKRSVRDAKLQ